MFFFNVLLCLPPYLYGGDILFLSELSVVWCLVSVCLSVTLLVRTITPDLLLLLKWNFIYGKIMRRGSAVHKVHNSSISIFWVIAPCWFLHYWPLLIFSFTLCPDDNFLSTTDIEMKPHIWKEHETRKCSAQDP